MTPVFFTDRDLGKRFPEILINAGLRVERHADHFAPDCSDATWLRAVGQHRWIAITHDSRIRYKPNELAAVMKHDVALLVVVGKAPHATLADSFVATYARILDFIQTNTPPYIAKVYRPSPSDLAKRPSAAGHISRWYSD